MGSQVQAHCACGYESDGLSVGGGMSDMGTVCFAPALSRRRKAVVARDMKKHPQPKSWASDLVWYHDPSLRGDKTFSDDDDDSYFCPSCEKMTMRFEDTGLMWD